MFYRLLLSLFFFFFSMTCFGNNITLPDIGDNAGNISPAEESKFSNSLKTKTTKITIESEEGIIELEFYPEEK